MSRPKNKKDLLFKSKLNFDKLSSLIDNMSEVEQEREFPNGTLNRNIRDVLAHLHHWHLMMFKWYRIGMSGEKPKMPAPGYTWKATPELNVSINKKYKSQTLEEVKKIFNYSHLQLIKIIHGHSNKELFIKKYYNWTGSTSLGAYLISSTSSHYDWAIKLIKKAIK